MLEIKLNKSQLGLTAKFFVDLAKIWFASGVIGFFIPGIIGRSGVSILIGSLIVSFAFLLLGINLLRSISDQ